MKSFADTLKEAEVVVGMPGLAKEFAGYGQDIREYAETVWPAIADRVVKEYATQLACDMEMASPIEKKLYLALQARYIEQLMSHPSTTCLRVSQKASEVSKFLASQGQPAVYSEGDVDFEVDLFLYLDCYFINVGGRNVRCPCFLGIECDGHDFHERTKEQAAKDRSKDRVLKVRGLDIIRFTGSEITRDPGRCAAEVDNIITAQRTRVQRLLGGADTPDSDEIW
jgi:hypothetical protein